MLKDFGRIRLFLVSQTRDGLGLLDSKYPEDRAYESLKNELSSLSLGQRIARFSELLDRDHEVVCGG